MKLAWLFKEWIACSQQEANWSLVICTLSLTNTLIGV